MLFEAIIARFYEDPTLVAMGEENRDWGGRHSPSIVAHRGAPLPRLFSTPHLEARPRGHRRPGYALPAAAESSQKTHVLHLWAAAAMLKS